MGLQSLPASLIQVEHPHERFTLRGADQPSSLQYRCHLLRPVDKCSKLLACQPQPEIPKCEHSPHVPTVTRLGEGQHLPRFRCRCPEQRLRIRVATHNAVKSDHVSVEQSACNYREVAKDKLSGTRSVFWSDLALCDLQISR